MKPEPYQWKCASCAYFGDGDCKFTGKCADSEGYKPMTNNGWIKYTDKKPTQEQLMGHVFWYSRNTKGVMLDGPMPSCVDPGLWFWQPANLPPPPIPEEEAAFDAWYKSLPKMPTTGDAWLAAIAWERARKK